MRISEREKRGGDGWILALLLVAAFVLTTVYFRESPTGPLHTARSGVQAALAPVSRLGYAATSPVRAVSSWFGDLGVSRSDLEALRAQNEEMRARLAALEEARQENERLRELVEFVETRELEAVGARVIGKPATLWEGVITIDRGTAGGVEPGMPVLAAQGLIGQIVEVAQHSSRVRLITDQRSGVSAMLQSTRAEGIVNGSIEGDITLDFVSRESTVTVGEAVLTSGMGGVYPKGLLIGEVADVQLNEADLFPRIRLRPTADLAGLEEVVVLVGAPIDAEVTGGGE
ncbi:MAG: rod shape-determining protein MreC [Anaerosomatales bacterium]|nr:rod shape-determining protein MreC [Anaerosomatales bacterium]MDT8433556.1 rod shape-determining protein MreC [Anaerosomatales bacterium]